MDFIEGASNKLVDTIEETGALVVDKVTNFIWGQDETEKASKNRYESFSKVRENVHAKWYVDGKDYFYAISEALSAAEKEIFIEDWWLSPELYLRRPPCKNEEYRLDKILKKKAEQGVKVYIILYKEVTQALTLNSKHSKSVLNKLHPNILVQRHPDHGIKGTFLWAHHEKIVVIDRHISFVGGLDLCFGRYDTHAHQLSDFHPASNNYSIWPGQDYSNPRIKDFIDVNMWAQALIDKKQLARMPWHDIHVGLIGKPALDEARHFIERWNFIKKEKSENKLDYPVLIAKSDRRYDFETPPSERLYSYFGNSLKVHPEKGSCKVQICRSSATWSHGIEIERSIQNAYIDVIKNAKHFIYIENQFFITATKESQDYPVKNLIGRAIVDRILEAHREKQTFKIIVVMPLLPAFPAELDTSDAGTVRLVIHFQYQSICRGGQSILEVLKREGIEDPGQYIRFFALRTYDKIHKKNIEVGLGKLKEEIELEASSKNEKSDTTSTEPPGDAKGLTNVDVTHSFITEELYIHSKLLVADDRIVICGSANLNDRSQNGDHDSEIAAVIEDTCYIDSKMGGKPWKAGKFAATLRRAIFKEHLGLQIDSDHEACTAYSHPPPYQIEVECDSDKLTGPDKIVEDPASDEFFNNVWTHTASGNTEVYREVFHCTPDDTVTDWDKFKAFNPDRKKVPLGHVCCDKTPEEIESLLKAKVKGHLVIFPLEFMKDVTLSGSVVFDAVTPMELFT